MDRRAVPGCLAAALLLGACRPDLGSPASLVTVPRIIAVRLDPPEVTPGRPVAVELFAAGPQGRVVPAPADIAWDLCLAPKPPAENNVVSRACVGAGPGLQPAGTGLTAMVTVPVSACALHGPDTPPVKPGEPPLRARDADVTGGYYQPISVRVPGPGLQAFALERIGCNLPGVSLEVAQEFQMRYRANRNPSIARVTLEGSPLSPVLDRAALPPAVHLGPGRTVALELAWTADAREPYPVFDVGQRRIVDHLEDLVVSWFVTAGSLTLDRTGRGESESDIQSDTQSDTAVGNTWTAPDVFGPVHLWVVLRDNRGGTAVAEYLLAVP